MKISEIVTKEANKLLSTRKRFNQENILLLLKNDLFLNEVKQIQKSLKIPKLNIEDDLQDGFVDMGDETINVPTSEWLDQQSKTKRITLKRHINKVIDRFELPLNFYDWLEAYILYRKSPYKPLFNSNYIDDFIRIPKERERIGLTTQEKEFMLECVKLELMQAGIKIKVAKTFLKQVKLLLKESKNKRRAFRSINEALKTLSVGKTINEEDVYEGTIKEKKYTFSKLVVEKYPELDDFSQDIKLNNRLRKQHQRLQSRLKK